MKCEEERGTRLDKKRKQKQRAKMQLLPRKAAARSVTTRETERSVASEARKAHGPLES